MAKKIARAVWIAQAFDSLRDGAASGNRQRILWYSMTEMNSNAADVSNQGAFSLPDPGGLTSDFLALSRAAMQDVGPAAQTLAAVDRIARNGLMFASVTKVALMACLPGRTCERHMKKLVASGWLFRRGRETPRGKKRRRRTVTYELTPKAKQYRKPFAVLPRWICPILGTWGLLSVFAIIASRHTPIDVIERGGNGSAYDREEISVSHLAKETGLSRRAVIDAKAELQRRRFILIEPGHKADCLILNNELLIPAELYPAPQLSSENMAVYQSSETSVPPAGVVQKWRSGGCKNGGAPSAKMAVRGCKNGGCSERENLKELLNRKHEKNAAAENVFCKGVIQKKKKPLIGLTLDDLTDPQQTEARYREAVENGLLGDSESDRVDFFAAASCAEAKGRDSVALFASIVNKGDYSKIAEIYYEKSGPNRRKAFGELNPRAFELAKEHLARLGAKMPDPAEQRLTLQQQIDQMMEMEAGA